MASQGALLDDHDVTYTSLGEVAQLDWEEEAPLAQ